MFLKELEQGPSYLESNKHQARCHCRFSVLKYLEKGLTDVFRRCKPSSKVRRKYLVMKKLKNQEPKQSRYSPLSKVRFMF